MAETNRLLKKAIKSTYKKLTGVSKQYPKKAPNNMKTFKKTEKTVKFIENPTKDNKDTNEMLKGKNVKNSSEKNITPHMNTISKIQMSDSD